MRTAPRLLAVASATLLLLAGCSAGSAPDSPPDATVDGAGDVDGSVEGPPEVEDAGNAAAWCALASTSLIDATLGLKLQEPIASFSAEEVNCDYQPVGDGDPTIVLRFLLGQDHDSFAAYRTEAENPSEPSEDLAGVGDEAFYRRAEFGDLTTHVVAARKGSVVLLIDAPTPLEEVTDLVSRVLAQLV